MKPSWLRLCIPICLFLIILGLNAILCSQNGSDNSYNLSTDNPKSQIQALETIISTKDLRAINSVISLCDSEHEEVSIKAMETLGHLKVVNSQVKQVLEKQFQSDNRKIQAQAINTSAQLRIHPFKDKVLPFLNEASGTILKAAIAYFSHVPSVDAFEKLEFFVNNQEPEIRAHALSGLALSCPPIRDPEKNIHSRTKKVLQILQQKWATEDHPEVIAKMIAIEAQIRHKQAIPNIIRFLHHNSLELQIAALNALGILEATDTSAKIKELLNDPSEEVRAEAIQTLAKLKQESSLEMLKKSAQEDESETVRLESIKALKNFDPDKVIPFLSTIYETEYAQYRKQAVEALSEIKTPKSASILMRAIHDSDPHIRLLACSGLGVSDLNKAVPILESIIQDETQVAIRRAAIRSLGLIGTEAAYKPIIQALLIDDAYQVRAEAAGALARFSNHPIIRTYLLRALEDENSSPVLQSIIKTLHSYQDDREVTHGFIQKMSLINDPVILDQLSETLMERGIDNDRIRRLVESGKNRIESLDIERRLHHSQSDISESFVDFYFIDSAIGQFLIYVITIIFGAGILFILINTVRYIALEYPQLRITRKLIQTTAQSGADRINRLHTINAQLILPSIIKKRIEHYLTILHNKGDLSHEFAQELTFSQETNHFTSIFLRFAMGIFVILGLLGTFWGVSEMVVDFDKILGKLESDDPKLLVKSIVSAVGKLNNVLGGMRTAFSTSIFGLGALAAMSIFVYFFQWIQYNYFIRLEKISAEELIPALSQQEESEEEEDVQQENQNPPAENILYPNSPRNSYIKNLLKPSHDSSDLEKPIKDDDSTDGNSNHANPSSTGQKESSKDTEHAIQNNKEDETEKMKNSYKEINSETSSEYTSDNENQETKSPKPDDKEHS